MSIPFGPNNNVWQEIAVLIVIGGMSHLVPFVIYSFAYDYMISRFAITISSIELLNRYIMGLGVALFGVFVVEAGAMLIGGDIGSWSLMSVIDHRKEYTFFLVFVLIEIGVHYLLQQRSRVQQHPTPA